MSAPLENISGATVAQNLCATAGFALKINLAAQKRATALPAVAQERSKLDFISEGNPGETAQCRIAANGGINA